MYVVTRSIEESGEVFSTIADFDTRISAQTFLEEDGYTHTRLVGRKAFFDAWVRYDFDGVKIAQITWQHSANDDTTTDIFGYTGYDEVDEDGKLVPVYDNTEAMYAANVAYEDRVNPAVWDVAVAHDSDAWCDSCGRMRAYCVCDRL